MVHPLWSPQGVPWNPGTPSETPLYTFISTTGVDPPADVVPHPVTVHSPCTPTISSSAMYNGRHKKNLLLGDMCPKL